MFSKDGSIYKYIVYLIYIYADTQNSVDPFNFSGIKCYTENSCSFVHLTVFFPKSQKKKLHKTKIR